MRVWVKRFVPEVAALMYIEVDENRIVAIYPSGECCFSKIDPKALSEALDNLTDMYDRFV